MARTSINRLEDSLKVKHKGKSSKVKDVKKAEKIDAQGFAQRVEVKAYELFEKRGCACGYDWDDWFEAERLVEQEIISGQEGGVQ